jgi:hypothetical protein
LLIKDYQNRVYQKIYPIVSNKLQRLAAIKVPLDPTLWPPELRDQEVKVTCRLDLFGKGDGEGGRNQKEGGDERPEAGKNNEDAGKENSSSDGDTRADSSTVKARQAAETGTLEPDASNANRHEGNSNFHHHLEADDEYVQVSVSTWSGKDKDKSETSSSEDALASQNSKVSPDEGSKIGDGNNPNSEIGIGDENVNSERGERDVEHGHHDNTDGDAEINEKAAVHAEADPAESCESIAMESDGENLRTKENARKEDTVMEGDELQSKNVGEQLCTTLETNEEKTEKKDDNDDRKMPTDTAAAAMPENSDAGGESGKSDVDSGEDTPAVVRFAEETKENLAAASEKGDHLRAQLLEEQARAARILRRISEDYEKYNAENMDDLFDDDDEEDDDDEDDAFLSGQETGGQKNTASGLQSIPPLAPDTIGSPDSSNPPSLVHSRSSSFGGPPDSLGSNASSTTQEFPTPSAEAVALEQQSREAYARHVKNVVADVHTYMEKLLVLFTIAYEQLDCPLGRDQCYASLEETFFKPLWKYLLMLFRYQKKKIIFYAVFLVFFFSFPFFFLNFAFQI